jgi:hypothetical protein
MKKCFRCKKEKPLNKFHKHKDMKKHVCDSVIQLCDQLLREPKK